MALEVLVHGEVTTTLAFAGFELQYLEQTLIATTSNVTLVLIPVNHIQGCIVWHTNLKRVRRKMKRSIPF